MKGIVLLSFIILLTGCVANECYESQTCDEYCQDGIDREFQLDQGVYMKTSEGCCCSLKNQTINWVA